MAQIFFDECMDKLWYISTTEYYLLVKRNEWLMYTKPWWTSRELCWVGRKADHKRFHTVWFHLSGIFEMREVLKWRDQLLGSGAGEGGKKMGEAVSVSHSCGDGCSVDHTHIIIPAVKLCYSFARYYHWGKKGEKTHRTSLCCLS